MRPLLASGNMDLAYGTILALNGLVSMVTDAIGGATAGLLAKRRGALHGLLAMVLASAFGLVVSVVMLARYHALSAMLGLGYWVQWLGMALLGLAIGSVAGLVAAKLAAAKTPR
jgi:hypothetical protein